MSVVTLSLWAGSSGLDPRVASVRGRGGRAALPVVPARRSGAAPLTAPRVICRSRGLVMPGSGKLRGKTSLLVLWSSERSMSEIEKRSYVWLKYQRCDEIMIFCLN